MRRIYEFVLQKAWTIGTQGFCFGYRIKTEWIPCNLGRLALDSLSEWAEGTGLLGLLAEEDVMRFGNALS